MSAPSHQIKNILLLYQKKFYLTNKEIIGYTLMRKNKKKRKKLKIFYYFNLFLLSFLLQAEQRIGFLFVHGLGGNCTNIECYMRPDWTIIQSPYWTFNFSDVSLDESIRVEKVNLAQKDDIADLAHNYKQFIEIMETQGTPLDGIILIGLSRGASTIITFVATHHPPLLKAIVLESPFDTIENVIQFNIQQRHLSWIPGIFSIIFYYYHTNLFPRYDVEGIKPLQVVTALPLDLPILFVHSAQDNLIPFESSQRLFKLLRQTGHKNAYLLELPCGRHAHYQLDAGAPLYKNGVHAFFHKFGLPSHKKDLPLLEEVTKHV